MPRCCSHCKEPGHTYVTCLLLTQDQVNAIKEEKKNKAIAVAQRRREREEKKKKEEEEKKNQKMKNELYQTRKYLLFNNNEYELVVYWKYIDSLNDNGDMKRIMYISPYTSANLSASWSCRITAFPLLEVVGDNGFDARKNIPISELTEKKLVCAMDVNLKDHPTEDSFHILLKYGKKKNEIEQWKEFGLKSHFLLKQIENLSSNGKDEEGYLNFHEKYENITPFLEMISSIKVPDSCSDVDKEKAGIPSKLTNVT